MTTELQNHANGKNEEGKEVTVSQIYSGPIPPPKMLEEYERVVPGAAKDILNELKEQGKHRRWMEKAIVFGESYFPRIIALVISVFALVSGVVLVLNDKDVYGIAAILTPLAMIIGSLLYKKIKND